MIVKNAEEVAQIEARDTGKPLSVARADIVAVARYFEYYGGAADKVHGEQIPYMNGYNVNVVRVPHGVTAHIIPWNYPAQMFGRSLAPALAMGNAAVLKPSEDACLSGIRLAELAMEAGLPPGALNVVTGYGHEAGAALTAHTGINFATFTGSPEVGVLVQACIDTFGIPDIVINNAGTTHKNSPMLSIDEKTFDRVFNVNVKSIYFITHAIVPLMRQRGKGGVMLNVGSTAGIRPRPGLSWYNASKGAVNLLSKSMAVELAPDRIRVNALCPVMGATGLLGDFMGMPDTPENRAKFISTIPLGRFCDPKDMAAAAVFLGTDAAEFLTGLEMPVDGGRTI